MNLRLVSLLYVLINDFKLTVFTVDCILSINNNNISLYQADFDITLKTFNVILYFFLSNLYEDVCMYCTVCTVCSWTSLSPCNSKISQVKLMFFPAPNWL